MSALPRQIFERAADYEREWALPQLCLIDFLNDLASDGLVMWNTAREGSPNPEREKP